MSTVTLYFLDVKKAFLFAATGRTSRSNNKLNWGKGYRPFSTYNWLQCKEFLELFQVNLQFLIVNCNGAPFTRKDGICIGAVIALALSDLFLGNCDGDIDTALSGFEVASIWRYDEDYLIALQIVGEHWMYIISTDVTAVYEECVNQLAFIVEA